MLLKADNIKSCYIGPEISPEEFIAEHFFLYLVKGKMHGYDGKRNNTLLSGQYCIVRKNHLARYNKERENDEFKKVIIIFDEPFLKNFKDRHHPSIPAFQSGRAFFPLQPDDLVPHFIHSLTPYYIGHGKIDARFADIKREELLLILLQSNPKLAAILFDFGIPEKIDLEAFMIKNYKFNVNLERFAYLTGRSLSAFKRDFEKIFNSTPSHWLIQKRLDEAHFLLEKKNKKASDIYLDLGFEDLSHFSFAFKKRFGHSPTEVKKQKTSV